VSEVRREAISFKRLAEVIIKERGIHEGLWGIYARFGFVASIINVEQAPEALAELSSDVPPAKLAPGVVVPLLEIGIQPFQKPNDFTVDAAEVNPAPKTTKKGASKKAVK
jgi:hypothetical protein